MSDLFLLIGQTPQPVDWSSIIATAKDSGFLGVVIFLFFSFIPKMQESHRAERAEWLAFTKESHQRFEALLEKCVGAMESVKK